MQLTVEMLIMVATWCGNPSPGSVGHRVKECRKEAVSCIEKITIKQVLEGHKETVECLTKSVDKVF